MKKRATHNYNINSLSRKATVIINLQKLLSFRDTKFCIHHWQFLAFKQKATLLQRENVQFIITILIASVGRQQLLLIFKNS